MPKATEVHAGNANKKLPKINWELDSWLTVTKCLWVYGIISIVSISSPDTKLFNMKKWLKWLMELKILIHKIVTKFWHTLNKNWKISCKTNTQRNQSLKRVKNLKMMMIQTRKVIMKSKNKKQSRRQKPMIKKRNKKQRNSTKLNLKNKNRKHFCHLKKKSYIKSTMKNM